MFEPSELQKEIMQKLWAMRNNFGPNVIKFAQRMRIRSRVDREVVLSMPFGLDGVSQDELDVDSLPVAELFQFNFIEDIPEQNEMFKRIGSPGMIWCQDNMQTNEEREND